MTTVIHLVRHAEVENPSNTWYGHLEGFALSRRGQRQAEALAETFSGCKLTAVYASPLTRTIETATAIAKPHGLDVVPEPDLIETRTYLEGKPAGPRLFLNPLNLRFFVNPFRPSWGEPYEEIAERMERAIERMRGEHAGEEVVAVSHMTPIAVARMRLAGDRRPAWMAGFPVERASVTTVRLDGEKLAGMEYVDVGRAVP